MHDHDQVDTAGALTDVVDAYVADITTRDIQTDAHGWTTEPAGPGLWEQIVELVRRYDRPAPTHPRGLWLTDAELDSLRARCTTDVPPLGTVDALLGVPLRRAGCDACSTLPGHPRPPSCSCDDDCRSPRCEQPARAAKRRATRLRLAGLAYYGLATVPPDPRVRVAGC